MTTFILPAKHHYFVRSKAGLFYDVKIPVNTNPHNAILYRQRALSYTHLPILLRIFAVVELMLGNLITAHRRKSFPCARISPTLCHSCYMVRWHIRTGFGFYRGKYAYLALSAWKNPFFKGLENRVIIIVPRGSKVLMAKYKNS